MYNVNRCTSERRRKLSQYLRPQLSLLMLRLYHLRRNFDVSIKFISQHVEDDNICEKVYDH